MDIMATIIFMSRKMRRLFEGGYHLRYALRALLSAYYSIILASQVDEAFCFYSIDAVLNVFFFSFKVVAIPSSSHCILALAVVIDMPLTIINVEFI